MDEIINMREDAVRGVAIRRQRRRFPFEIFNTLLTIICLATAALVVYKLFQSPSTGHNMGMFMFVIHAEAEVSAEKVTLTSTNSPWVKNNAIVVPCDGLYMIYAQISWGEHPQLEIQKKEDPNTEDTWTLLKANKSSSLVTVLRLNTTIQMLLNLPKNGTQRDISYLGIVLLQVHQDVKSCQEIIQNSCKEEKDWDKFYPLMLSPGKCIRQ
ncbi:uncharacterized protein LOC144497737 [Mustelus asterias]